MSKLNLELKKNVDQILGFLNKGLLYDALNKIETLREKNPKNYLLINLNGIILNKLKRYDESVQCFEESVNINPNNSDAYNNLGTTLGSIGKFKYALECFQKASKLNPQNNIYLNNIGNLYKDMGDFENAISFFIKAINNDKKNLNSKHNLIKTLTFINPKKNKENFFIKANKLLQSYKTEFNKNKTITNDKIKKVFNDCLNLVDDLIDDTQYGYSHIYRLHREDMKCDRHHKIFKETKIIPENCFSCYKVQANPRNVIDLIKLYFVFDMLRLKNNNNRKTFCETRPYVKSTYVGNIYCYNYEEAKNVKEQLVKLYTVYIDKSYKIWIKRGCSEFGLEYEDYKEVDASSENFMKFDSKWKKKEDDADKNILIRDKISKRLSLNHLTGITLHDILSIKNWLFYAKKIGDNSYKEIYNKKLVSVFMEKILSEQISSRIKNLQEIKP